MELWLFLCSKKKDIKKSKYICVRKYIYVSLFQQKAIIMNTVTKEIKLVPSNVVRSEFYKTIIIFGDEPNSKHNILNFEKKVLFIVEPYNENEENIYSNDEYSIIFEDNSNLVFNIKFEYTEDEDGEIFFKKVNFHEMKYFLESEEEVILTNEQQYIIERNIIETAKIEY